MNRKARDNRSFALLAAAAIIACAVFFFWGQYNTASTIYEVGFMLHHMDELLDSAKGYTLTENERERYDSLRKEGAAWEEHTDPSKGSYETETAAKWFGEQARTRLLYSEYSQNTDKTVILLHGIGVSDADIWAPVWWNMGYNVIIPEMRADESDRSSGTDVVSYGVYEQFDLYDLIMQLGLQDSCVWVQGRGSGAAAAILLAGNDELSDAGIDGIVSESVYNQFGTVQRTLVKQLFNLGDNFVGRFLRYLIKTNLGFEPDSVSVSNYAAHCSAPILFLCSDADGFIDSSNTDAVYEAAAGRKEVCRVPSSHHLLLAAAEGSPCQNAIRAFAA